MSSATHSPCRSVASLGDRLASGSLLLLGAMAGLAAGAGTIVNSNGFEPPYAVGPLAGQFSWQAAGSGSTSATVQNAIALSGSQAVLVSRTASSDKRFAVPSLANVPSQRYIIVDWDMRVSQSSAAGGFGPFFGVDSYDDEGTFGLLGSFGMDATTGELLYQLQGTGELTPVASTIVPFNTWHHYRIVYDFTLDSYQSYYDGVLKASTGFVDGSFGLNDFSDADIAAFAAGPDSISQGLSASAVFDNFVIRDGLLGDYNLDGAVNATDYTTWRSTFGAAVAPAGNNADGNKNGIVDAGDYVIWRDNQGATLAGGADRRGFVDCRGAGAGRPGLSDFGWGVALLERFAAAHALKGFRPSRVSSGR